MKESTLCEQVGHLSNWGGYPDFEYQKRRWWCDSARVWSYQHCVCNYMIHRIPMYWLVKHLVCDIDNKWHTFLVTQNSGEMSQKDCQLRFSASVHLSFANDWCTGKRASGLSHRRALLYGGSVWYRKSIMWTPLISFSEASNAWKRSWGNLVLEKEG